MVTSNSNTEVPIPVSGNMDTSWAAVAARKRKYAEAVAGQLRAQQKEQEEREAARQAAIQAASVSQSRFQYRHNSFSGNDQQDRIIQMLTYIIQWIDDIAT